RPALRNNGRRDRGELRSMSANNQLPKNSRRGFAGMTPERRREIARRGGKTSHAQGGAHQFTPEEARRAGRQGGLTAHAKGVAHKCPRQEAAAEGRQGGRARAKSARRRAGAKRK